MAVPFDWEDPEPLTVRGGWPLSEVDECGFFGVEPFAMEENPLETECSEASTGRILVSSKRLRLRGGLSLPA